MNQNNESDIEKFFRIMQEKMGGNINWSDLPVQHQLRYIDSVNFLIEVSTIRKD